jgi:pheromone shutdown protein TraB
MRRWLLRLATLGMFAFVGYMLLTTSGLAFVLFLASWSVLLVIAGMAAGASAAVVYAERMRPVPTDAERLARADAAREHFRETLLDIVQRELQR